MSAVDGAEDKAERDALLAKHVNIGCGGVFHPGWKNLDLVSVSPHVTAHDLRKPLPFEDNSIEVIYHSHLLEHLNPQEAKHFLSDIGRVLRPGGVMRVVIPNLEDCAELYLRYLHEVLAGEAGAAEKYDWMTIEFLDQLVRSSSGGFMRNFLMRRDLKEVEFLASRAGDEFHNLREAHRQTQKKSLLQRVLSKPLSWYLVKIRFVIACGTLRMLGGKSMVESFREGHFRRSGEVHQWMYDRYSIKKLLEQNGFKDVRITKFSESRIPHFDIYELDHQGGAERKPSSLYVECLKA